MSRVHAAVPDLAPKRERIDRGEKREGRYRREDRGDNLIFNKI